MSHLEQAIRDAMSEGYNIAGIRNGHDHKWMGDRVQWKNGKGNINDMITQMMFDKFLLDPAFWQALGKARGWDKCSGNGIHDTAGAHSFFSEGIRNSHCYYCGRMGTIWKDKWHSFIDHLAQGKDIESFFATISTNN